MATPDEEGRGEGTMSGLSDIIERTLLIGIGAAAMTKDRVQAVVDDFVRRGQLTREEGREVVDNVAERSREEARSARRKVDGSLQSAYRELGLTTRQEVEDLDFRLRQVEHRVDLLERQAGTTPPSYEETP